MALTHAILSALVKEPYSGYDLAKQFDGSVGFFWKATHQQIYRELTKLEDKGLLSVELIRQEGRPDKKIYSVTQQGKQFLADWIAQPCSMGPVKEELLVKVFSGNLVEKSVILAELERHRQMHQERLSKYQQIEKEYFTDREALKSENKFGYLTLRRGIRYESEWIDWCSEAIAFLS